MENIVYVVFITLKLTSYINEWLTKYNHVPYIRDKPKIIYKEWHIRRDKYI